MSLVIAEQATVYRVGRRRYFTLQTAARKAAIEEMIEEAGGCDCTHDVINGGDLCAVHAMCGGSSGRDHAELRARTRRLIAQFREAIG